MSKFHELISSDTPVLVDFYADWCQPCHHMTPILKEAANQLSGKAKVIKVNIDKNQKAANRYGVRSIPTLLLFQAGEVIWRQAGVVPAANIVSAVEKAAAST